MVAACWRQVPGEPSEMEEPGGVVEAVVQQGQVLRPSAAVVAWVMGWRLPSRW